VIAEPKLALPLVSGALAVFSGGGTMAQEAALLGVPVFSYYPGELPAVHRFLMRRGLLRVLEDLSRESIERAVALASDRLFRRRLAERARRLREQMEDPAKVIADSVTGLAEGGKGTAR
jgi:predicted glycosyltransferase